MDWSGVDYLWIIVMFLSAVWSEGQKKKEKNNINKITCVSNDLIQCQQKTDQAVVIFPL